MPISGQGGARIKSVQRGVAVITGGASSLAVTVAAVDTARAQLQLLGWRANTSTGQSAEQIACRLELTNATTVTVSRLTTANEAHISWELTEWQQ